MISVSDILAARPNIEGDWIEIIIPILIIVGYAVTGIFKMRSNLKEQQSGAQAAERPRYRPLDESAWERPQGAVEEKSAHLERTLESRPSPRPSGAGQTVRQSAPVRYQQAASPQQRRTLDAFLATPAPKPLAERIAEARAKAEAAARAQARQTPRPSWPRAAERMQTTQMRKPKIPAAAGRPATAKPPASAKVPVPARPQPPVESASLRDSETLRKAIVYAEILGTPVALRDMPI